MVPAIVVDVVTAGVAVERGLGGIERETTEPPKDSELEESVT